VTTAWQRESFVREITAPFIHYDIQISVDFVTFKEAHGGMTIAAAVGIWPEREAVVDCPRRQTKPKRASQLLPAV
jgi:hypothetical protein